MEASKDLAPAIEGITDDDVDGDSIDGVIRSLRRSNLLMALLVVLAYIKAAVMITRRRRSCIDPENEK